MTTSARRLHGLLERANRVGRQQPDEPDEVAVFGHYPVPPTMRCTYCGRPLRGVFLENGSLVFRHAR